MLDNFGYTEMLLLGVFALLLFGSKLPDMARNFGRTYREYRKKIDDIQREFRDWDKVDDQPSAQKPYYTPQEEEPSRRAPTAPKFIPPSDDD